MKGLPMTPPTPRVAPVSALETAIPPPLVFLVTAASMGAAGAVQSPSGLQGPVSVGLAIVLFAVAGIFGPPAIAAFGRARTTIDPVNVARASTLVMTGLYSVSRNPMYVSMAALLTAIAALFAQPVLALGPVLFVLYIQKFQIRPKERALLARFGAAYEAYRSQVRPWI